MIEMKPQIRAKNRRIRNLLLFSTIALFFIFIGFFISSFQQYRNIQQRIQSLIQMSNDEQPNFSKILTAYNEAENYFRLFSIDFHEKPFSLYQNKLKEIDSEITALIVVEKKSLDLANKNAVDRSIKTHERLIKDFVMLKIKINDILESSKDLKNLPQELAKKENSMPSKTSSSVDEQISMAENEIIVKRPFLQRLFNKRKNDTIKYSNIDVIRTQHENIINEYEKEITLSQVAAEKRLAEIKKSFKELRQKERALLSNNFTILYGINEIIRNINENHIRAGKEITYAETQELIKKSDAFKWQIFLCLIFMFIMICIIVYYQFFTSYYEQKLEEEKQYASKLAEEKTNILAEITHEIRTPINSLIGILDLLKKKKDLYNDEDQLLVNSAYSSIINTSKTIDDILNLSKLDYEKNVDFKDFDIEECIIEIVDTHRNQALLKDISLEYYISHDMPTLIYSDEFKIRQIINNLISNAIKYSNEGRVVCSTRIDPVSNLIVTVTDEGIGISEDIQHNIFKKYYTINKNNNLRGGVGLGLFITKNLVNSLDGKITFTSIWNKGTTFKIEIPIPQAKFKAIENINNNAQKIIELPKNYSCLIIDDNALNLLYLKQFFTKFHYVKTAVNGLEGLNILKEQHIDLVITDINMPIMTGDEFLVNVRQNPQWNSIKVIATSSDNEQVKKLENKHNIHFDGILIKPFNEKKLVDVISKTISPGD